MKLVNQQIYNYAQNLQTFSIEIKMPVRVNFYLQKNIQLIQQAAEEIDKMRLNIISQFGILNEEKTTYIIPPDKIAEVNNELNDLFNLEQELNLHIFKLSDFDNIELTFQELSAIMFMIEEE